MGARDVRSLDPAERPQAGAGEILAVAANRRGCSGMVPRSGARLSVAHECLAQGVHGSSQVSDPIRFCQNCGSDIRVSAGFCAHCGKADPEVEEAWRVEVERRIGQIERGEARLIPGDEVFTRLRRRLG